MTIKEYTTPTGKAIRLIHGDCMEWMKECEAGAYNLSICDPPYGIGQPKQANLKGYNGRESLEERLNKNRLNTGSGKLKDRVLNQSNCEWDNAIPTPEFFDMLTKVSDNQIIWGGNYFPLPPSRCVIAWDKCQPWQNFSQWEMAWTSFDSPARLFQYDNRTGGKIHPTQKPVKLYRWLLTNYAKPDDRILDTHGGSMSHAIACWDEDFALDIIELDRDYYEAAVKRFEQHIRQTRLFT